MTDIVLINPGDRRQVFQALGIDLAAIEPPFWVAVLAAYLRNQGFSTRIIDANALDLTPSETAAQAAALDPRLVAVIVYGSQPSASTQNMTVAGRAAAAAETISRTNRDARMATRAERIDAINETSIRMLSCTEPNEVARLATSSAAMILEADHAILRLQDPTTRRYTIRSYFGAAEGSAQESLFRLDKAVTVDAIRRRAPHLIQDASLDPNLSEFSDDMRSVLTAPIKRSGEVVGSVSVYDKVALDRFFASRFDDEDLQVFGRFVAYVERALDHALAHRENQQHRNFDEETGLPNQSYLEKRLQEEISRAAGRENALALCVCRLAFI